MLRDFILARNTGRSLVASIIFALLGRDLPMHAAGPVKPSRPWRAPPGRQAAA